MADDDGDEDDLAARQAGSVYPIGRALRATYRADNHDSLGADLTGLMLALARVETPTAPPAAAVRPEPIVMARVPWWARLFGRIG